MLALRQKTGIYGFIRVTSRDASPVLPDQSARRKITLKLPFLRNFLTEKSETKNPVAQRTIVTWGSFHKKETHLSKLDLLGHTPSMIEDISNQFVRNQGLLLSVI